MVRPQGRVVWGLVLALCLAACAAPGPRQSRLEVVPAPLEVAGVPFFPQDDYQCGPAALATLLAFTGRDITPEALVPELFVPGRRGSLAVEMAVTARRHGRLLYPVAGDRATLLAVLAQGHPVLVLQNNGLGIYPLWHFAVVVAADPERQMLWLRSGRTSRLALSFAVFERTWARAGHWAAIVLDPAALPENLDEKTVIRELALMEKAGAVREAQAGFARAVIHWPEQRTAWLGLANASLALGETARAESTLRELVRRQPQYGPGLNNLADLLFKTGRADEALSYAERAVAVLDIPATRATLSAVRAALSARPAPGPLPPSF